MKMNYIGHSEYDYPAYEDENNRIWLDINYGSPNGNINLYSSSSNGLEGEPNVSIEDVYPNEEIEFETEYRKHHRYMDYSLLGRYKADCKYFLGNGNGYVGHVYFHDINKHIEEMKNLYNSFSEEDKPEWITLEDIEKYHTDMKAKLAEVSEKAEV